jgi:hypothetical protein
MMQRRRFPGRALLPAALLLATVSAACAPLNGLDGVLGSGTNTLNGEVRSVDTRRARIQVREQYGRDYTVRYDNRTQVVYGSRRYPVSALERGDRVRMRVEYDRNDNLWAERIEVRDTRGGRDDRYGTAVQRHEGRVRAIDTRRGYFTLDRNRGASLIVYVPRNARREDVRRFDRLRRNDRVRVEVRVRRNSNEAELVRFR